MVRVGSLIPGVGSSDTDAHKKWPKDPKNVVANGLDTGVFINELSHLKFLPWEIDLNEDEKQAFDQNPENISWRKQRDQRPEGIQKGTYRGTQLAMSKAYDLIEQRYISFMDVANFEPLVPPAQTKEQKCDDFAFTKSEEDGFPPHLNLAGNKEAAAREKDENQKSTLSQFKIFNAMRLVQLTSILPLVVPQEFHGFESIPKRAEGFLEEVVEGAAGLIGHARYGAMGTPDAGTKIANVEDYNRTQRARGSRNDIFDRPNVGDLKDWYTDARFAQQHFTGTNPTTIERASDRWIQHFIKAASADDEAVKNIITDLSISSRGSLYMQDYSYFREAAGLASTDDIKCEYYDPKAQNGEKSYRYGCASVCLFYLNDKGQLYPLAIVIDWRGSIESSVTVYNGELIKRTDIRTGNKKHDRKVKIMDEAVDWAWRYAKSCVQCSDWLRHEVTAHLTRTHLIEEAVIVACNRKLDPHHPVFRILRPHWQKTLALNAAARSTLVPHIILEIIGFDSKQALQFIRSEYKTFDFKKSYIPTDLKERGFPPEQLNSPKFHNYAYARCINSMWNKIRAYVESMLSLAYPELNADQNIRDDNEIQDWSAEMRSANGADLPLFPTISTFAELVDCVTMCIHIASPQHTAVNYLQDYYQAFVINKPPSFFTPPPTSLQSLLSYTEDDLVKALPMNHPREWLLSSHVPYLLNFKPDQDKETLIACAHSQWLVYRTKTSDVDKKITEAIGKFYTALADSEEEFVGYARATDDYKEIKYEVLNPDGNAVSILI